MTESREPGNDMSVEVRLALAERREAALSGLLRAIAEAGDDLDAVLFQIAGHAAALSDGVYANVFFAEGGKIATYGSGMDPAGERRQVKSFRDHSDVSAFTEVLRDRRVLRFDDQSVLGDDYAQSREAAVLMQTKSSVYVPLPNTGAPLGIYVARSRIEPFTDDDVDLLQSFAVQAGNAAMAAKQRQDLNAALEQQTASAEVMRVISSSPGDLERTLPEIARTATRLSNASHMAVTFGGADSLYGWDHANGFMVRPGRVAGVDRIVDEVLASGVPAQLVGPVESWFAENPTPAQMARLSGITEGACLFVPLRGQTESSGFLIARRDVPVAFSADEIRLLEGFADQAVIALDNAAMLKALEERNTDLAESLELQTATSEILALISANPGDLEAVFTGICEQAARLCDADHSGITRYENGQVIVSASSAIENRVTIGWNLGPAPSALPAGPLFFDDGREFNQFATDLPLPIVSGVIVRLIVDGELYGTLTVARTEVRPFEPRHGRILEAFAEQAVIAVSNASLFRDLDEALARQTAMTEVLDVVSTSRLDLQPVYDVVARHAGRLCGGHEALVSIRDGDDLVVASRVVDTPEGRTTFGARLPIDESSPAGRACITGELVHVRDWASTPADFLPKANARVVGAKASLAVPMLRNGVAVGVLGFMGDYAADLTDSQVALLQVFANQAAIAVDNARLLREIEARNNDLAESLELQTATSEILALISANPGDLEAVFTGICTQAARLCSADHSGILRYENGQTIVAASSAPENRAVIGMHLGPAPTSLAPGPVFIDDLRLVSTFAAELPLPVVSAVRVPLLFDGTLYGQLTVGRGEVRPFDPRHGRILEAFAEQASIAISNAKLFNDLDAALERQTAITDVLDAVSTARFDPTPVFEALVRHASRLCGGTGCGIALREGDTLVTRSAMAAASEEPLRRTVRPLSMASTQGAAALLKDIVHVRNFDIEPADRFPEAMARAAGFKSALAVPLMRDNDVIGVFSLARAEPGGFNDTELSLLKNFADQAAIAIDNARLLREIEAAQLRTGRVAGTADCHQRNPCAHQRQPGQPRSGVQRYLCASGSAV